MYAYCANNPATKVDWFGEYGVGVNVEVGKGWYYRIDPANTTTGTKRHIHIWNNKKSYIQNEDGSPHDKGKGQKGKIPKWLNNELIKKAGWDYNGNRSSFFEGTSCKYLLEGNEYTFSDGATIFERNNPYMIYQEHSVDSYENLYFEGNKTTGVNSAPQIFYLPIIGPVNFPSFSFGFSWGWLPLPLLY